MIPPNPHPWVVLEHEGERYMVRHVDGVVWVSRISDRALWLYDPASTAPTWTALDRVGPPAQLPMF